MTTITAVRSEFDDRRDARPAVGRRRTRTRPEAAAPPAPAIDDVRQDYFKTYYPLAVSLARRFSLRSSWGESMDDLTQVALLGLVRAIGRFDAERGVPFSAFATATIVGELKHHLRDRTWTVRPPRRIQNLYLRSHDAIGQLTQEMGRCPTASEIAERVDASEEDVVEALEAGSMRRLASLDTSIQADAARPLSEQISSDDNSLAAVEARMALGLLLATLPERERRLVRLRFIDGLTQNEIASRMSLSQAHVQRLLVRSLDQLRALATAS
ncbi:MAG: sigma-70 family RNA polymerase sigma factor [Actinomycetota bacterium]|nr:sigma-70 family RNA polymerase sigma factor [Actinomycetota bacterium]